MLSVDTRKPVQHFPVSSPALELISASLLLGTAFTGSSGCPGETLAWLLGSGSPRCTSCPTARCDSIAENRQSASARLAPKLPESRKRHAGNERCHGNARGRAGVGSAGMVGTGGSLFQQPGVRGRGRSERSDFVRRCRGAPAPQPTGRGAVCRPRRGLSFTLTHVWLLAVPPAAE